MDIIYQYEYLTKKKPSAQKYSILSNCVITHLKLTQKMDELVDKIQ